MSRNKLIPSTLPRVALCLAGLIGALSAGCAETETGSDAAIDAGSLPANSGPDASSSPSVPTPPPVSLDASVTPPKLDASVGLDSALPTPDASTSVDASTKPSDASVPLDANVFNPIPTDTKPADWKLKPGSAQECPPEPPPIPIIGGLCAGIYFMCGWETSDGRQYSCTCDWVHYLCI
jgi:hypothetical protein